MVDRRHCTNIRDVGRMKGAETESDNVLVRAKIRLKIKSSEKTKKGEIKKWDIGKLNKKEVQEVFIKELTANVQNTQLELEDINETWNKIKKKE
jgi:1,2-phenylacetyl-CoA epoxidase catalytic subunit